VLVIAIIAAALAVLLLIIMCVVLRRRKGTAQIQAKDQAIQSAQAGQVYSNPTYDANPNTRRSGQPGQAFSNPTYATAAEPSTRSARAAAYEFSYS
jgi:hypothetical protein